MRMRHCQYCFGINISKFKCNKCNNGFVCIYCQLCDSCLLQHTDKQLLDLISSYEKQYKTFIESIKKTEGIQRVIVSYKKGDEIFESETNLCDGCDISGLVHYFLLRIQQFENELEKRYKELEK
jgi:hypothetical protein